jgi:hypothetical protein
VKPDDDRQDKRRAEHEQVGAAMVERRARGDDQRTGPDHRQRDAAVETPHLGVRPRIERPGDLAAVIRVGAQLLEPARVAHVGAAPVPRDPHSEVGLDAVQRLAVGTLPGVELLAVEA